ncbi:hypothetical protein AJ79_00619 [Helicocarpus griseus UAMH5409]|uniref:Uncharacterized protein n=1 Tax=Helicocarpus griseus UAMH5409 TaxID=1447875 RepID=A0A2B7YAR6_9EURO|nr:hypothetical protein AJ79_00619 [Helicocarpus griseus UAMH5409]
MAESKSSPLNQASSQTGASLTASAPHLRHRPLTRSATGTFAEPPPTPPGPGRLRRSSTFSDTVSEARQSIKSSTDDLFLPRVHSRITAPDNENESHWQSVPLVLALLPAVGGLLFKNGTAVATDITLLIVTAVFLNWSIRLPWDWYRSAQEMAQRVPSEEEFDMDVIIEEPEPEPGKEEDRDKDTSPQEGESIRPAISPPVRTPQSEAAKAAVKELHQHELVALASCFVFPLIGAWLLHAIRSQLSRPSEGLVSNYNLTIFLLAAEIRPFSHLLKMVQARTLYLQRVVASSKLERREKIDAAKIRDLSTRLEELEAHIADSASKNQDQQQQLPRSPLDDHPSPTTAPVADTKPSDSNTLLTTLREQIQPDLEALNRAMRRYEKRTALSAYETETRLQSLEKRVSDAISLSAATQRSTSAQRRSPLFILLNWLCAAVVLPMQALWALGSLPPRAAGWGMKRAIGLVMGGGGKTGGGRSSAETGKGPSNKRRSGGVGGSKRSSLPIQVSSKGVTQGPTVGFGSRPQQRGFGMGMGTGKMAMSDIRGI